MGLFEDLNSIYTIKNDIKSVLVGKGVDMTNYSFPDYPSVISSLSGGGGGNLSELWVYTNGEYYPEQGYNGFSFVGVNVSPNLGNGYVFSSNGVYDPATYGWDGFASIVVSVPIKEQVINRDFSTLGLTPSLVTSTYIGTGAFAFCSDLEYVDVDGNVLSYGFYSCPSLRSAVIKGGRLYSFAFANCYSLETVNAPSANGGYISYQGVFKDCTSLREFNAPRWTCPFGAEYFAGCVSLSSFVVSYMSRVENYTFSGCSALSSIDLYECRSIGSWAFNGTGIQSVTLSNCSFIGYYAFASCSQLSYLSLNVGIPTVISYKDCLVGTPFENGVGSIYVDVGTYSQWLDAGWSSFSSLIISLGDPTVPLLSFDNGKLYGRCVYLSSVNITNIVGKESITEVELPELTSANNDTFRSCYNLVSVSLPKCSYVTFDWCSSLTDVYIPNVEFLNGTFQGCTALSSVNLPKVSYLKNAVFMNCTSLTTVVFGYEGVVRYEDRLFNTTPIGSGTGSIFVPASLVSEYQVANGWSSFSSQIFAIV